MHLSLILDMAADALGDRRAVTAPDGTLTYAELRERADTLAGSLAGERAVQLGLNSLAVPVTLFAAARAGAAFTPLNYRLADPDLVRIADACRAGRRPWSTTTWCQRVSSASTGCRSSRPSSSRSVDGERLRARLRHRQRRHPAVHVGNDRRAEGGVLRHRHLTSYVMLTLEFAAAGEEEAALVSVPAYHIAGISADRVVDVRRPAHRLPRRRSRRRPGSTPRPPRTSPTPWSCRRCSGASST